MSINSDKRLKYLNAIAQIHHSIGARLEMEKVCQILVEQIASITDCKGCAILFIEGQKVKILSERGFLVSLKEAELTIEMPAIKYIIENKQNIWTGNISKSPFTSCVLNGCKMVSMLCVPIMITGDVKGIIHLDSDRENAFSKEDVEFIQIIANEIAMVIERSFLFLF